MKKQVLIRKLFAGMLMMLFALSIMPKQMLHQWFANHNDTFQKITDDSKGERQLYKAGFHCQQDNLVVETPFLQSLPLILTSAPAVFTSANSGYFKSFYSNATILFSLRGPPALG